MEGCQFSYPLCHINLQWFESTIEWWIRQCRLLISFTEAQMLSICCVWVTPSWFTVVSKIIAINFRNVRVDLHKWLKIVAPGRINDVCILPMCLRYDMALYKGKYVWSNDTVLWKLTDQVAVILNCIYILRRLFHLPQQSSIIDYILACLLWKQAPIFLWLLFG